MAEVATEPAWLSERRQQGASLAQEPPLPDQKAKGWEFTDLSGLDIDAYEPGAADAAIDGAEGATVLPLAEALESHAELLRERLGSLVPAEDPFVARNEAGWRDGVLVHVPARRQGRASRSGSSCRSTSDGAAVAWRTLVVLEEGAEAEVWEHWSSAERRDRRAAQLGGRAAASARRRRCATSTPRTSPSAPGSSPPSAPRSSATAASTGRRSASARRAARCGWRPTSPGPGSEARVTGGYAGGPGQHLDYDTTQEHAAPNTNSDLAFRGVLAAGATAVWRGMIKVDPGAQQTDAFQESRNLLLSTEAHADAIPGLEILADDVRCTHAAAIAQIDKDQLFYLTSRGLDPAEAKSLIIEGFLESLVERLAEGPVRDEISAALEQRLAEIL